jgi:outer membrane protein, heavy metal efflux system
MRTSVVVCVAVLIWAGTVSSSLAQSLQSALTLEAVLARARERAPEVVAALTRVEEARGRLLGASSRFRDNPSLEIEAGPRAGASGERWWDMSAGVAQVFETGGQRRSRIAMADSDVLRESASVDEVMRLVAREVAIAYVSALGSQERVTLLTEAEQVARDLQAASERRYQAGDIAALDLNLTRIALARATSERSAAAAEAGRALLPLRLALGLEGDAPIALSGPLERAPTAKAALLTAVDQSPGLRAVDAEIARARAEIQLGQGMRRPDVAARVLFQREEGDRAVLGGLTFTLPMFERGQGTTAEASARARRLTLEREAARRAMAVGIEVELAAYAHHAQGVATLRDVALPAAQDNESLALKSFEAGEISLLNLLLVRQDATAIRLSYVAALTAAAVAAVEIDSRAGVLR